MKNKIIIYLFLICILSLVLAISIYAQDIFTSSLKETKSPIYSIKIINIFPHDQEAFTQGLIYKDGFLYESTGLRGKSSLRKVDLQSGLVIKKINLPDSYFAEGITFFNNKIYQLTWKSEIGFIYNFTKLEKLSNFHYKDEGWGITTDGEKIFLSNGSSVITCREPESFRILKKINVHEGDKSISNINELEFIKGEIWANIFMKDVIVRFSPITGKVLGWVDLRPLYFKLTNLSGIDVLNGIAYDEIKDRIFVTGKYWPYLFEIKLSKNS